MKTILALLMIIMVLLVAGCVSESSSTDTGEPSGESETLTDVGNDISGLDGLDSDLDMSDLENLDSELEDLEW